MTNKMNMPNVNLSANHSNPHATLIVTPNRPINANTNAPTVAIHTIFVTIAPMVKTIANNAANQNTINALEKINSVLDSNIKLHRLHEQHIVKHKEQIQELSEEIKHTKRALLIYIWVIVVINFVFLLHGLFR